MATRANHRTKRNHSFNTWKSVNGDSQGRVFPVTNATIFRVSERSDMELMTHNDGGSRAIVYRSGPPDGQMDELPGGNDSSASNRMPLLDMLTVVPRPVFKTRFLRNSEYRRFIRIGYRILARPRGSDSTTSGCTGESICGQTLQFSRVQTQLIKARMPRRQRGTGLRSSSERVCRSALRCA